MSGSKNRKHIRSRRGGAHARAAREVTSAYDRTYGEDDSGFDVVYETKASGREHSITAWIGPYSVPYGDGYLHPEYYDKDITIRNMPDTLVAHVYVKNQDGTRGTEIATAETDITENLLDNMSGGSGERYNGISGEILPDRFFEDPRHTDEHVDYDDIVGSEYEHYPADDTQRSNSWDVDPDDYLEEKRNKTSDDPAAFPDMFGNDIITALTEYGGTPVCVPDKQPDSKLSWTGHEIFAYMKKNMADENGVWDRMTIINDNGSKSRYDRKREYDF